MSRYDAFIKTVETGSFSKAADQLGYTQSAVSQMIRALEQELSTTLINRTKNNISLTADGQQYYPYIIKIRNTQRELVEKHKEMQNLEGGIIRIATMASVSCNILPGFIKSFKEEYPAVEFALFTSDNYEEVIKLINEDSVDFGFINTLIASGLNTTPLMKDEFLAVLPENHRLAKYDTLKLSDLAKEPFILLEEGKFSDIQMYLSNQKIEPNINYRVFDDYTIMAMIEKEMGVGILPEMILKRTGYNIAVKHLSPGLFRDITIAYKDKDVLPIASKKFISHLKNGL